MMWSVIATWPFSLQAAQKAAELLSLGKGAIDAAEQAIWTVESDPEVDSVGVSGFLNRDGALELDAAIMDGATLRSGSVAGLKGYAHPISVARAVLEKTRHALLVGEGAGLFAREAGIECAPDEALITEKALETWKRQRSEGHDTIGLVALDTQGHMVAATSTSGASMKLPGRTGDSPLIGSGFYVEDGVGGCAATGLGEDIIKTCLSFRVVELMRQGLPPQEAAERATRYAHETILRLNGKVDQMALVCMNAQGEFGASCNHPGFAYARAGDALHPAVIEVKPVIDSDT